jgi:hypothetical protein
MLVPDLHQLRDLCLKELGAGIGARQTTRGENRSFATRIIMGLITIKSHPRKLLETTRNSSDMQQEQT